MEVFTWVDAVMGWVFGGLGNGVNIFCIWNRRDCDRQMIESGLW